MGFLFCNAIIAEATTYETADCARKCKKISPGLQNRETKLMELIKKEFAKRGEDEARKNLDKIRQVINE